MEIWQKHPLHCDEVILARTSPCFVASIQEIFAPLLKGACLYFNSEQSNSDLISLLDIVEQQAITRLFMTPSILLSLLNSVPDLVRYLNTVNRIFVGGEAISADLVKKVQSILPHVSLINAYGSTEVVGDATAYVLTSIANPIGAMPIGRPVVNLNTYVLDNYFNLCPKGVTGELYVGGPSLASYYYDRPDLTAASFLPDPFALQPGSRMYRLGDLVKYDDDGALIFIGRKDNQVQYNGVRIELNDVERTIAQCSHAQAVICRFSKYSDGRQQLSAYIMLSSSTESLDAKQYIKEYIGKSLPVHMHPSRIIYLSKFPVNRNGKVDLLALDAIVPDEQTEEVYVAPQSVLQEKIAVIWCDILKLKQVSIKQNFFDLGGNSLMLSKVHLRLAVDEKIKLSVMTLFEFPTIEFLSHELESGEQQSQKSAVKGTTRGQKQMQALTQNKNALQRQKLAASRNRGNRSKN